MTSSAQPPTATPPPSFPSACPIEYEVSYVLPEPFGCKEFEDSSSIEFKAKFNKNTRPNSIIGFIITVTADNEGEALEEANTQAERLLQIMTFKGQGYIKYACIGCQPKNLLTSSGRKIVRKKFTGSYNIQGMIDEIKLNSNQAIISIMQNDEDTNIQLHHFRLAIQAEENLQYANMYRELFQVIEKDGELGKFGDDCEKYKALRAAISHQKELTSAPTKVKEYFPGDENEERYEFLNGEFNHNSKKNRDHLKEDAGALKKAVIEHLTGKLR